MLHIYLADIALVPHCVERVLEGDGRTLWFLDGENDKVSLLEEIYNDHDHDQTFFYHDDGDER